MSATTDTRDWIAEGKRVAEYDGRGYDARVRLAVIIRLTKTQIVTDGERRYNRETLREVGKGYGGRRLLPIGDKQVRDAVARQELSGLRGLVDRLCKDSPNDADTIIDIVERIAFETERTLASIKNPERISPIL